MNYGLQRMNVAASVPANAYAGVRQPAFYVRAYVLFSIWSLICSRDNESSFLGQKMVRKSHNGSLHYYCLNLGSYRCRKRFERATASEGGKSNSGSSACNSSREVTGLELQEHRLCYEDHRWHRR